MTQAVLDTVFENLSSTWETALSEKRQHDVIVGGVLGYLFFHESNDAMYEKASLICVRTAINDVLAGTLHQKSPDNSQHACSFCCRRPPEVRLAAGANSFICDKCVSQLGQLFGGQ